MQVELRSTRFEPWQELADAGASGAGSAKFGATCAFVGTMRDFNDGAAVEALYLEHYPGMTERQLEAITRETCAAHDLLDARIVHRVGAIEPGEAIVLVVVWSAHRQAAFAGCRALMEALKQRAPFWKQERRPDGHRWVKHNTPG
jgi:molybdopterin synthase catalytic subunit